MIILAGYSWLISWLIVAITFDNDHYCFVLAAMVVLTIPLGRLWCRAMLIVIHSGKSNSTTATLVTIWGNYIGTVQ